MFHGLSHLYCWSRKCETSWFWSASLFLSFFFLLSCSVWSIYVIFCLFKNYELTDLLVTSHIIKLKETEVPNEMFKLFAIYQTIFLSNFEKGAQAVFSNFPVILTCLKKGSSSGHLSSVQFQDWCRALGYYIHVTDSCIAWVLCHGITQHFLKMSFWRGLLSKAVLEVPFALHTAERRGWLQCVCSLAQLCHY